MYFVYHEFHPFWFEFIPLSRNRHALKNKRKRLSVKYQYKRIGEERHGEYATVPYSIMIQIGFFSRSFVMFFMKHWNPLPSWALELLELAREAGKDNV
jgi:hypothetical protein